MTYLATAPSAHKREIPNRLIFSLDGRARILNPDGLGGWRYASPADIAHHQVRGFRPSIFREAGHE